MPTDISSIKAHLTPSKSQRIPFSRCFLAWQLKKGLRPRWLALLRRPATGGRFIRTLSPLGTPWAGGSLRTPIPTLATRTSPTPPRHSPTPPTIQASPWTHLPPISPANRLRTTCGAKFCCEYSS